MTDHINLSKLPPEHPLRNTPLHQIGAEYRNLKKRDFVSVGTIKIHIATYNQLSGPWIECNEWRCLADHIRRDV